MTGIAEWLASIGLGEYSQGFAENAIDPRRTNGVTPIGEILLCVFYRLTCRASHDCWTSHGRLPLGGGQDN